MLVLDQVTDYKKTGKRNIKVKRKNMKQNSLKITKTKARWIRNRDRSKSFSLLSTLNFYMQIMRLVNLVLIMHISLLKQSKTSWKSIYCILLFNFKKLC